MQEDSSDINEEEALELIKEGFVRKAAIAYLIMLSLGLLISFLAHKNLEKIFSLPQDIEKLKECALITVLGIGILIFFHEILLSISPAFKRWMTALYKMIAEVTWKVFFPLLLLAAFAEEIFIRAAIQPYLDGPLLTSLLYALFHLSPMASLLPSLALSFTTSYILGVIFDYTGCLYPAFIIHLVFSVFSWFRLKPRKKKLEAQSA